MASSSRLGLAPGWGKINKLRFNDQQNIFTVAEQEGIRIFSIEPLREMFHYKLDRIGSVAHVEQLGQEQFCAFIPAAATGNNRPKFADNIVLLFKYLDTKIVNGWKESGEISRVQFFFADSTEKPISVRMNRSRVVLISKNRLAVFKKDKCPQRLYEIPTQDNPLGLCEISHLSSTVSETQAEIMVFPGFKKGSLQIVDLSKTELSVSQSPVTINAHKSDIQCIVMNRDSSLIATASTKGTLIRIWSTVTKQMQAELRRGTDPALVHSINFSHDNQWLCCSSDKGTVHIFALQNYQLNQRSVLATIGVPGAYACSQYSLAKFTIPQECPGICCFGSEPGTVIAVCMDGSFHKYNFSPEGTCNQLQYDVFTQMCEDCIWEDMMKPYKSRPGPHK